MRMSSYFLLCFDKVTPGGARLGATGWNDVFLKPSSSVSVCELCWARWISRFLLHWKHKAVASASSEFGSGCFKPWKQRVAFVTVSDFLPEGGWSSKWLLPVCLEVHWFQLSLQLCEPHGVLVTVMQAVSAAWTPLSTVWRRFCAFFTRISSDDLHPGVTAFTLTKGRTNGNIHFKLLSRTLRFTKASSPTWKWCSAGWWWWESAPPRGWVPLHTVCPDSGWLSPG